MFNCYFGILQHSVIIKYDRSCSATFLSIASLTSALNIDLNVFSISLQTYIVCHKLVDLNGSKCPMAIIS